MVEKTVFFEKKRWNVWSVWKFAVPLHSNSKQTTKIAIMSYRTKLKIGEFSQMMQVTVKTLRHYEQKGLLMPDEVDEWTGYRYYTVEQMQRLNNIRELQQLGFSLDEIGLLYEDDSHDPTIGQLSRKIRDTEQQLRMLMDRREKLLNWRRSLKVIRTMEKFSIQ